MRVIMPIAKPRVYVAGPLFGSGRSTNNVHQAIKVAETLRKACVIPFVPHLFHYWDTISPQDDVDYWLEMCKSWLACCDAMIVLPGVSPGTRKEEVWAADFDIPVFDVAALPSLRFAVQRLLTNLHERGLVVRRPK